MIIFLLITIQIFLFTESFNLNKFDLICISKFDNYCENKKDGFKFNNGCHLSICKHRKIISREKNCKFHATSIHQLINYCQNVVKKNERLYRKFIINQRKNDKHKNQNNRNFNKKNIKKIDNFGKFHISKKKIKIKNDKYKIIKQIRFLKQKWTYYKKKILRLLLKKREIYRKYQRTKAHYMMSKHAHSFSLKTRILKYKRNMYRRQLKSIKRKIEYFHKKYKNIKKKIRRLQNKQNYFKNSYRSKLKSLHHNFQTKMKTLKQLKILYNKEKSKYKNLKVKKSNQMKKKNKIKVNKKKLIIIKKQMEEKKHELNKIKRKFLKYEGQKNNAKNKIIKEIPKKKDRKKDFIKRNHLKQIDLMKSFVKNEEKRNHFWQIKDIYNYLKTIGNYQRKGFDTNALFNNLADNQKITKKLMKIKKYFIQHFTSNSDKISNHFLEKLQSFLPALSYINRNTTNSSEGNLMNPLNLAYLRIVNDKIYRKYLKLLRLKYLENQLHKQDKIDSQQLIDKNDEKAPNKGNYKSEKYERYHKEMNIEKDFSMNNSKLLKSSILSIIILNLFAMILIN